MKHLRWLIFVILIPAIAQPLVAGRYYDARIARWAVPDPALRDHHPTELLETNSARLLTTSPYCYTFNSPLVHVDPDGKNPVLITAAGGSALYVGGAVLIAATGHLWNCSTNPAYRRAVDQGMTSFSNSVGRAWDQSTSDISKVYDATVNFLGSVFLTENSRWKGQIQGWVDKPVTEHLDKLEGMSPGAGNSNDPQNRNDWKKQLQKALNNISDRLTRLRKPFEQVLKENGWEDEQIQQLVQRLKNNNFKIPTQGQ